MPAGNYKSHASGGSRNYANSGRGRQSHGGNQSNPSPAPPSSSYSSSVSGSATPATMPLFNQYPISSSWEFTLDGEKVQGTVFCTDAIAQMVVLTDGDTNDFRLLSVPSIQSARQLQKPTVTTHELLQKHASATGNDAAQSRKLLEDREKRELKRMQESLKHINPKASPKAQMVYDKLLKACNEVEWKQSGSNSEVLSIVVMGQIQVDPPYNPDNCRVIRSGTGEGSLGRIQKIVEATAAAADAAAKPSGA